MNIHSISTLCVSTLMMGCATLNGDWEKNTNYIDSFNQDGDSNGIQWVVVNNYTLGSEIFYDQTKSIASLNEYMQTNAPSDLNIKKVAHESLNLQDSSLRVRDVPGMRTRHYDEGLSRYGNMIAFEYSPLDVELRGLGYSLSPQEADENLQYESLLPIRNWIVRLSVESDDEFCEWRIGDKNTIHEYRCDEFYILVPKNGMTVSSNSSDQSSTVQVVPEDLVVLALGDSYISGEGNGSWIDTLCHRSHVSWPNLLAARYASDNPHKSVTVISRACSGARIRHVLDTEYKGVDTTPGVAYPRLKLPTTTPPQLHSALLDLCMGRLEDGKCTSEVFQPDVILLSIGGNDAGFGKVIFKTLFSDVAMVENGEQRLIAAERKRLSTALSDMKTKFEELANSISSSFPTSPVIVTNYLNPLHATNADLCTGKESGGFFGGLLHPLTSFLRLRASEKEIIALQRDFIEPLVGDSGIAGFAKTQVKLRPEQWHFVRTAGTDKNGVQLDGLSSNGICLGDNSVDGRWFNRAADTNFERPEVSGTAHPNIFGQLFYTSIVYPKFAELLNE